MNPNCRTIQKILLASSILIACFVVFVMFFNNQEAKADINPMLNFTGKVTDSDSVAVADNVYNVSFGLYTTATSGTAIWSEDLTAANLFLGTISAVSSNASSTTYTYTGGTATSTLRVGQYLTNASTTEYELITGYSHASNQVTVAATTAWVIGEGINNRPRTVGGVVDIDLGSVSSLAAIDFNQPLYLQVTFNGETMQPRKLITAVAQAFNADKLDGYDASDFANIADDVTVTGEWDFANVLDIATSSATTALTVTQTGNGDIVNIFDGLNEVFTITDNGFVGIGTSTPYSKLSIWGSGNLLELTDTSSTTVFRVDDSGNLTITGTTTMGALTYPNYDGITNQVLSADGSGNIVWSSTAAATPHNILSAQHTDTTVEAIVIGDLMVVGSGTKWERLGIGTGGYVLAVSGGAPTWVATSTIGVQGIGGGIADYVARWTDANTIGTGVLYDDGTNVGIGTTSPYSKLTVWGDGTSGLSTFSVIDSASSTLFTILDSGKVGIGTSSPSYQLDIYGGGDLLRIASSTGDLFTVTDSQITSGIPHSFTGSGDVDLAYDLYFSNPSAANIKSYAPLYIIAGDPGTNTNLYLEGRGTGVVYVDDYLTVTGTSSLASVLYADYYTGRVGIGTSSPLSKLSIQGTVGADDIFTLASSTGANLLTVDYRGYLGIGTTSPSEALSVNGNLYITGAINLNDIAYTFPSSQTANYYLQSDGSGTLSWVDVTGTTGALNYGAAGSLTYYDSAGTTATGTTGALLFWDDSLARLGIGTTTPDSALTVIGKMHASSTGEQLRLTYDQSTSKYAGFTVDSSGDLSIDLATAYATTTFADNLAVTGYTELATTTMSVWNKVVIVDGVHYSQDGAGIQAAINAAGTSSKVFLPAGTYNITTAIKLPSKIMLEGAGASTTVLYLANGSNCNVIENADQTNGNTDIRITNLGIDGNATNNSDGTNSGIYFENADYSNIDYVRAYNADYDGIWFESSASSTISNNILESNGGVSLYLNSDSNNNTIIGNTVTNNSGHGITIYSSSNNTVTGNTINKSWYGLNLSTSSNNNTIIGNVITNHNGWGMSIYSSSNNSITGNVISNNAYDGIHLNTNSNNNTITGNNIYNSGSGAGYDGIALASSDNNIISSNRITDTEGTGYAIDIDSDSDNNVLVGNYYSGTGASSINDAGTNTRYTQPERLTITTSNLGEVAYSPFYIHASSSVALLSVRQDSDGDIVNIFDGANEVFTITDGGFVGIGTTTPWSKLTVDGSLFLEGSNNYINFGTATSTDGYGFYDNSGTLQFKNSGGTWVNFGVGTVGDGTIGQFPYYAAAGTALTATSSIFLDTTGYVGIGTTSPQTLLTVYKSDNDALISFGDQNSNSAHWFMGIDHDDSSKFKIASSTQLSIAEFTFTKDGYLGIGTTSPQAALHIGAASTSNLTTFGNSLFVSGELEVGETAYLGPMEFGADSGVVTWIDMPVTSASATGTVQSYTARLDGANILTVYGEASGYLGSIENTKVGIGTTTPFGVLSVSASSTDPALVVQQVDSGNQGPIAVFYDGASEKIRIDSSGYLGIGTTSPLSLLSLQAPAGSSDIFTIASSTGANLLTMDYRGYLGIGTTSPTQKLSTDGLMYIGGTGTSTIENNLEILGALKIGSGSLYIDSDSIENLSGSLILQPSSGNVGIGTSSPLTTLSVQGTAGTPIMNIASSTGASVLYVDEYGRVGIGTDSPAYTLDVSGNVRATLSVSAGINVETLSGDKTLTPGVDEMHQYLDEGGANRIITLATAGAVAGDRFIIRHNGAYNDAHYLEVKQSVLTLDKIYAGAIKEFIFDGTNWISGETGAGEHDNKNRNIAIGNQAAGYIYGTAIGSYAIGHGYGTAVGYGAQGYISGVAVGYQALGYNHGAAIGSYAESSQYGFSAGYSAGSAIINADSIGNILIGYDAGNTITTGDYNIIIGYDVDGLNATADNFLNIGNTIYGDLSAGNVGIGTSTLYSKLTVWGDGTSGLSAFSVIDSASTTLFTVLDNGYVGIGTSSPAYNLDVYGTVRFGSSTAGDIIFETTTITNPVLIGIGTSTPDADLTIVSDQVNANTYLFTIATSTSGSDAINLKFIVDSDGDVWADGGFASPAADYAEYFYTVDTDLQSGEVVCVDVTKENAVKRCERGADGNVMGIVSTNPAIVGNVPDLSPNPSPSQERGTELPSYLGGAGGGNYVIVGLLGQVPARVSTENGEIRPGDSLTSASSTPGYVMKAGAGDPTVGIALEYLTPQPPLLNNRGGDDGDELPSYLGGAGGGIINVLISRRNKSLTVEMVEAKITDRIAAMEIEDEVQILIARAVDNLNLDSEIQEIVDEQMALLSSDLTVEVDAVSGELMAIAVSVDDLIARMGVVENNIMDIDSRLALFEGENIYSRLQTGVVVDENGNIKIGNVVSTTTPSVAVVEIITATTTNQTAFVVNQQGDGDVADFRADDVSVVNIADSGKVTIIGEMLVDGRIMVCSGGACGNILDERVDETMGDMGVEGTIVAGAFEGYCEEGFVWVQGSAKYGTLPGFCVMDNKVGTRQCLVPTDDDICVNISQGEAMIECQGMGDGYHLISENEWLTIAENVIRVVENDVDEAGGLQLATTSPPAPLLEQERGDNGDELPSYLGGAGGGIGYVLTNGNIIYNLIGAIAEWTDQTVTKAGLITPISDEWIEYYEIENYNGFNIAPPYYYSSENGIGKIKTGSSESLSGDSDGAGLRGFVRGYNGIYSLDLSNSPTTATSTIGFRCAR